MNQQATLEQLRSLRLHGMADAYEAILAMPVHLQPDGHELLARLAQHELESKHSKRTEMYLRLSKLRYAANLEEVICSSERNLTRQQLGQLEKTNLIILDDFGLQPLNAEARLALLQILEDRYRKKSMIIASQLSIKVWYEYLQDPTLADAILDRLTAHAHRIELKGKSLRHTN